MTTALRFTTIFVSGKSHASPTQVRHKPDTSPTLRERLRTIADACEHKRNDLASPPGPLDPNLKTGTILLRIGEKTLYLQVIQTQIGSIINCQEEGARKNGARDGVSV